MLLILREKPVIQKNLILIVPIFNRLYIKELSVEHLCIKNIVLLETDKSFKMNRVRNGSSSRPGSGVGENTRMLRDTVVRLEQELLDSRAETKKVSDQLSCLMLLVKR